jgi:DNA-binding transcriptional MerR regulator
MIRKTISRFSGSCSSTAGEGALEKAPDAFRTISEVAEEIDVPQHVLRFWESRFTQIRPLKRGGGRRYYRPDDIDLLRGVRHLLYSEGYTIRGVQRILREEGLSFVQNVWRTGAASLTDETADEDRAESAEAFEDEEEGDEEAENGDEGDDEEDAEGETATTPSRPPAPSVVAAPAPASARTNERREPNLIPPAAAAAGPAAAVSQGRQPTGGRNQQKLQTALDELIACRNLIRAALAETAPSEDPTDRAG